jgi:hypothetical protein
VRSGPGAARTILLFHTISARPSKQPRMVGSTLGIYSFELIFVSAILLLKIMFLSSNPNHVRSLPLSRNQRFNRPSASQVSYGSRVRQPRGSHHQWLWPLVMLSLTPKLYVPRPGKGNLSYLHKASRPVCHSEGHIILRATSFGGPIAIPSG